MSSPLVSIIIPSFNRESLIGETLNSILNQTYTQWECIVVDDGSTDRSMQVLRQFAEKDNRIKVFSRDRLPKGAPVCRNIGLAKASGDYVMYLDSDDVLAPFCLEQRVTLFQQYSDCQFLVFMALLFKDEVTDADRVWNIETDENDLVRFLRMDALWQTTGPIYKRDYLVQMRGFKEELPFWQDFDLHLRCLFSGAAYKKCFNHPPDYYIRTGRTDTISRSTPFTGKREILDQRIAFYYDLIPWVNSQASEQRVALKRTLRSTLYFLCAQYLMRYSKPGLFISSWQKAERLTGSALGNVGLSVAYAFLLKFLLRFSWMEKPVAQLARILPNSIPDYFMMSKNTLEKMKAITKSGLLLGANNQNIYFIFTNMKTVVFTLCSNNYLAHAKTLGDSVLKTNPNVHFIIGLVDKRDPAIDYDFFKAFEIIDYDQIGFPFFEEMLAVYNVIEFNTAVKPYYLEFLLTRHGSGSKVFYIDPDIVLYAGIDRLSAILDDNNIVLTPMLTVANATVTMDELVALRHGIYNLGFIGIKYSDETFRFVKWWQERLRRHCVIDKPRGLFVDQKWIDLAPLFFTGIFLFPDPGYNMSWWNFAERQMLKSGDQFFVNDVSHPLVFFHFSGYNVGSDYYTGRVSNADYALEARPDLIEIFKDYSSRLKGNQYDKLKTLKPLLKFAPIKKAPKGSVARVKSKVKSFLKRHLPK